MDDPSSDLLSELKLRASSQRPQDRVVTADEVAEWPTGMLQRLLNDRVLEPIQPATSVACDACDEDHVELVQAVEEPAGSSLRFYIPCPAAGRAMVDTERMRRWKVSSIALAPLNEELEVIANLGVAPPNDPLVHSPDYSSVSLGSHHWPLAPREAKAIAILHSARLNGHRYLPAREILVQLHSAGFSAFRMNDVLRRIENVHQLVTSPRRGHYGLAY